MVTSIAFKTSLMIFFRQFLLERRQRYLVTSITVFYCAISVLAFFLALVPCGTLSHLARKRVEGKCIPTNVWNGLLYTHGAVSALSDWVFALLPILVLWKSSMPAKTKLGVTLLMVFAVCGSLCAVLRTIYTGSLHFDARYYDVNHKPSYQHVTALVINMAVLEMGIGITAASVACLMPLFRRCAGWFQRRLATRSRQSDIQGRRKDGVSTTLGETNSDQWRKWEPGLEVVRCPAFGRSNDGRRHLRGFPCGRYALIRKPGLSALNGVWKVSIVAIPISTSTAPLHNNKIREMHLKSLSRTVGRISRLSSINSNLQNNIITSPVLQERPSHLSQRISARIRVLRIIENVNPHLRARSFDDKSRSGGILRLYGTQTPI